MINACLVVHMAIAFFPELSQPTLSVSLELGNHAYSHFAWYVGPRWDFTHFGVVSLYPSPLSCVWLGQSSFPSDVSH